jgi:hypothetical protein
LSHCVRQLAIMPGAERSFRSVAVVEAIGALSP